MPKSIFRQPSTAHDTAIAARLAAVASRETPARDELPSSAVSMPFSDLVEHTILRTATLRDATGRELTTFSCAAEVGRITIGRGAEAHIRVNDPSVSTLHAAIVWDTGRGAHVIRDVGSTNGTFVNKQRLHGDVLLQHGATIRLGRTVLRYCQDAPG